ncbi:hypothetical protein C8R48DRAFT_694040 [Suillus tomentosus]|nr:hypothetical protein C8R48DRAFT_694040 [Suillus tomentosus]
MPGNPRMHRLPRRCRTKFRGPWRARSEETRTAFVRYNQVRFRGPWLVGTWLAKATRVAKCAP